MFNEIKKAFDKYDRGLYTLEQLEVWLFMHSFFPHNHIAV